MAKRFAKQKENLATAGLHCLLKSSEQINQCFHLLLHQFGLPQDVELNFKSQFSPDSLDILDIVGYVNDPNKPRLIVECKLDALISEKEQVYFNHLSKEPSLYLFVVSHSDMQISWKKVEKLFEKHIKNVDKTNNNYYKASVGQHFVVLTSWSHIFLSIIDHLHNGIIEIDKDDNKKQELEEYMSDAKQILGLCNEMDRIEFIHFNDDDSTKSIPKRLLSFINIIDDVCELLDNELDYININRHGYKIQHGRASSYRKMAIHINNGALLIYDCELWSESKSNNPLWLKIQYRTSKDTWLEYTDEQKKLVLSYNKDAYVDRGWIYVPLIIKRNCGFHEVVNDLKEQIVKIADILPKKH